MEHPNTANELERRSGYLPVHLGAKYGAPLELMCLLIHLHPDGLQAEDEQGNNPIWHAEMRGCDPDVTEYMRTSLSLLQSVQRKDWPEVERCIKRCRDAPDWIAELAISHQAPPELLEKLCERLHPVALVKTKQWKLLQQRLDAMASSQMCLEVDGLGQHVAAAWVART